MAPNANQPAGAPDAGPPTLVLVDGSSYLFRAFHALPALSNSKGLPTGAVYGVGNMLRRLIADYRPTLLAVVFDAKGKTFRDDLYPQYKANRPPMPKELAVQIEPLHELIRAMGLPLLIVAGVEADDVIGTLTHQAAARGMHSIVSTGDKDMAQLVDDSTTLVDTMSNSRLDPAGVEAKFGVPPERIVDWLALMGDTVDNIPGVPKVGPKTAAKWLRTYGTLDNLIHHADEIKGKVGEHLRASLSQLPLSRKLATIDRQVDLPMGPEQLRIEAPRQAQLIALLRELELKTWLAEQLQGGDGAEGSGSEAASGQARAGSDDSSRYETVLDHKDFETWMQRLRSAELFAFDTETTGLDTLQAELVGVSFAVEPGQAAYVPLAHRAPGTPRQLPRETVLQALKPLLENPQRAKVGQNLKYDMSVLARCGIAMEGIRFDTMLESYVLDSTATRHDMDALALKYLGIKTIHFEDIAGKGKAQKTFDRIELEQAAPYAAEDADVTLRLHRALWPKLQAEPRLLQLFRDIEMPLVPVLSRMERNGVLVDAARLERQSEELAERLREIEERAYAAAGGPFNLASPKQIQTILFDRMGLPVLAKTPKGAPSTAESVLQELAEEYDLPRLILDHRSLAKLRSTYTEKLPQQVRPETGRVHTSYHQAVAATGRLSSSDPNLQNIPVRTEEGRRIRQAFIAPPGHKILAADYSQIELRIMAHLSQDASLLRAFSSGRDIHRATAAEVFGVPPEQVDKDLRRSAKAINFGLIYGMSSFGLARQLGIERGAAQAYIDLYFERCPGVKEFMDRTREQARRQGWVETVYGRRLYLPDIRSSNRQRRQYAERTAINAPMQGTAADIIKRAMIRVDAWLRKQDAEIKMIMQVHDELVFEVPEGALSLVRDKVPELMTSAADLSVPLEVETGIGDNWDQAH
jgi:DNA polymerase-1